ncbi:MAG: hypothetical protein ACJAT2_001683 [Bacteriovoracaceae bacterium]|jgi:hypothetical protein
MLSRKEQTVKANFFPKKWTAEVKNILEGLYKPQCDARDLYIEVHAITYPNELILAVSLLDKELETVIPITYMASADLNEKENPEEILNLLVDSIGFFFDNFFNLEEDPNETIYSSDWEESKVKDKAFHFKITRENIGLSLMADALLGDEFES